MEGLVREQCTEDGLLPWTIKCFFCNDIISYSSCIDHFKNDCEDLNWIQEEDNGTCDLLNSCIIDNDDSITVKLKDFSTACIILPNTVVMLRTKAGCEFDEEERNRWDVALVGSDASIQLKYSEEMTERSIKYVLLEIQPSKSFKEFDITPLTIFKGVLRIVKGDNEDDTKSIDSTQFFRNLVDEIKERERDN